jgi:hypothetical protein
VDNRGAIPPDTDSGFVKRGFVLLALMGLLVTVVLFILFQGRRGSAKSQMPRAEDYAWSVAIPTAGFPANISWAALHETANFVPSPAGWEIRYNAAATLAQLGSNRVPWHVFVEMLDLRRTTVNLRNPLKESQVAPEAIARELVAIALRALAEWHTQRRAAGRTEIPSGLAAVYEKVDALAENPDRELSEQAKKTQATFFRQRP